MSFLNNIVFATWIFLIHPQVRASVGRERPPPPSPQALVSPSHPSPVPFSPIHLLICALHFLSTPIPTHFLFPQYVFSPLTTCSLLLSVAPPLSPSVSSPTFSVFPRLPPSTIVPPPSRPPNPHFPPPHSPTPSPPPPPHSLCVSSGPCPRRPRFPPPPPVQSQSLSALPPFFSSLPSPPLSTLPFALLPLPTVLPQFPPHFFPHGLLPPPPRPPPPTHGLPPIPPSFLPPRSPPPSPPPTPASPPTPGTITIIDSLSDPLASQPNSLLGK
jgi:hypothetical protein